MRLVAPSSSAIFSEFRKQSASSCDLSLDLAYVGPTVWITQRAFSRPAVVATAWPVGNPSGFPPGASDTQPEFPVRPGDVSLRQPPPPNSE